MNSMAIVLADDHHVVREGLKALLETELVCSVVGEAADGFAAVATVERLRPDILVLDLFMPGLNGLEVIRRVRQHSPHTRIVVLSMHADASYVREALRCGATAYVLKESKAAEFVEAVRAAAAGRRYLSPALSEHELDIYIQQTEAVTTDLYDMLTERERDVLHLSAQGLTSAEIAARLAIGTRTVESYRANLMRKLGLHSQTDLVRYALRRGIIPLAP